MMTKKLAKWYKEAGEDPLEYARTWKSCVDCPHDAFNHSDEKKECHGVLRNQNDNCNCKEYVPYNNLALIAKAYEKKLESR